MGKKYGTHGENAFPSKGKLSLDNKELRLLKKKMADLEEENAIRQLFFFCRRKAGSRVFSLI